MCTVRESKILVAWFFDEAHSSNMRRFPLVGGTRRNTFRPLWTNHIPKQSETGYIERTYEEHKGTYIPQHMIPNRRSTKINMEISVAVCNTHECI